MMIKSHWCNTSSFANGTHLVSNFDKLMQLVFIFIQSCIHFSPSSNIYDGKAILSSTPQRFSMGLWFGLCGGNPCEKIKSHAPWTTSSQFELSESWHCHLEIWFAISVENNPLMEIPDHEVYPSSQPVNVYWLSSYQIMQHRFNITCFCRQDVAASL